MHKREAWRGERDWVNAPQTPDDDPAAQDDDSPHFSANSLKKLREVGSRTILRRREFEHKSEPGE